MMIFVPSAYHLLFHFVLQNEIEQQMVGNWSKIRILVLPSAHHSLFHVALQNEIEQQIDINNFNRIHNYLKDTGEQYINSAHNTVN